MFSICVEMKTSVICMKVKCKLGIRQYLSDCRFLYLKLALSEQLELYPYKKIYNIFTILCVSEKKISFFLFIHLLESDIYEILLNVVRYLFSCNYFVKNGSRNTVDICLTKSLLECFC